MVGQCKEGMGWGFSPKCWLRILWCQQCCFLLADWHCIQQTSPPLHCTVQALNCRLDLVCCTYIIMYISHCKIYDWNSMSIPACIRCYLTDTLSRPSPEISKCPYSDKYITLSHWDTRTKQGRHGWEGWWGKKWWQKEGYQWQSTSRLSGLTWQKKQWTNLTKLQDTV